ncbi:MULTISPECIES: methylated-DNA--[protein]-cysteine S-methyltransferase [Brevibacillus]|uniref:Methylated-DNA--protein-cysteine methyltransferase n=1 Tax=Brevibacillus invocatus TaxID=173959 RepID=A0A3M8C596_9BACL|nr:MULTISPECIES: methylated-DNA--[protein]-cysteine S-methyltransferase [Brevibacillus]MCM3081970.1 methylated-DNA--[protein]-cysteine S-methyltransferase [Brevibacillus invocatus]MCM3432377.1 methylated-DNA--[protein]-cysteine S-methyltransferase [Brevibacillus invocatus]MDH4619828.1 methylated-DNA--[protein]-cysteine S-methyltransferase [Brevibacillus sp. AY1]RNB70870.1 methylated-DNA--[protein]-cysteine S-methyltransferase [Brevibacillus invocatus]
MTNTLQYTIMDSPIGPLLLASTEQGLCFIEFGDEERSLPSLQRWCKKTFLGMTLVRDEQWNEPVKAQLEEYFAGLRHTFDLPFVLYGTPFQKSVWTALTSIPYGETRSYKDIALAIGASKAVRAIGGANNRNPIPVIIPCHRVIGSNGALVGYGGGLPIKEYLLSLEKVPLSLFSSSNQVTR